MTAELVPAEVVAYHGLKPGDRMAELMILLGERYRLDPLVGHLEVIKTKSGPRLYITRDGYLEIAHRSQMLDGLVTEDLHHGDSGWSATVSVWRKDCRYPFTYSAGCGDREPQALQGDGEAMALARAERRALKRAFPVIAAIENEHGLGGADERPREFDAGAAQSAAVAAPASAPVLGHWVPTDDDQGQARMAVVNMPIKERISFLRRHGIDKFDADWPVAAIVEVLAGPAGVTPAAGDTTTGPADST